MAEKKEIQYQLDEDGYVVVEFIDEDSRRTEDDTLISLIHEKKFTRDTTLNAELIRILCDAYHNEHLAKSILEHLGLRPLPLITELRNKHGKTNECFLFPHQINALAYMREREAFNPMKVHGLCGGIIKMDMGMGKTITSISHSLISERPRCSEACGEKGFPTLIIASKTVMIEWKTQGFEKFFGNRVKVLYLHSTYMGKDLERVNRRQIVKYDFVVTTYDLCISVCRNRAYDNDIIEYRGKKRVIVTRTREQTDNSATIGPAVIYTTPWERVICDESQRFANHKTKTYLYIMAIYGRYKWCLTGTPIRNSETDVWSQLRFCGYNAVERSDEWIRYSYRFMTEHGLINAILIMNYDDTIIELPPKHEYDTYISLGDRGVECYNRILRITCRYYDEMMNGVCDFACVLALFTRLRQCAIAPYLLTIEAKREKGTAKEQEKEKESFDMLKEIYTSPLGEWIHNKYGTAGIHSEKMTEIIHVIEKIPNGEKVLIFSMFTSVLDLVADALTERLSHFEFVQVDGDTKGPERLSLLEQFRTNTNTQGLLMTYKVGSEGLNLAEATHVICVEPWWTNAVHNQAKARCWRTGQTKEVKVHNIYVKGSIEERIVDVCKWKDGMSDAVLEGKEFARRIRLDKNTLGVLIGVRRFLNCGTLV